MTLWQKQISECVHKGHEPRLVRLSVRRGMAEARLRCIRCGYKYTELMTMDNKCKHPLSLAIQEIANRWPLPLSGRYPKNITVI